MKLLGEKVILDFEDYEDCMENKTCSKYWLSHTCFSEIDNSDSVPLCATCVALVLYERITVTTGLHSLETCFLYAAPACSPSDCRITCKDRVKSGVQKILQN